MSPRFQKRTYPVGSHAGVVVFRLHDQRWAVLKEPAERLLGSGLLERLEYGIAIVEGAGEKDGE